MLMALELSCSVLLAILLIAILEELLTVTIELATLEELNDATVELLELEGRLTSELELKPSLLLSTLLTATLDELLTNEELLNEELLEESENVGSKVSSGAYSKLPENFNGVASSPPIGMTIIFERRDVIIAKLLPSISRLPPLAAISA